MATKPSTYKRLMVQKLTTNFEEAVTVETAKMCSPIEGEICIKNKYVGINATDVNISKGRYFTDGKLPFSVGFEGVGEVVEVGKGVDSFKVGQSVAYISSNMNAYSEYSCVAASGAFPIPEAKAEFIPLLVSGLTSTIGLDKSGRIMAGETVLITAAAGGAGHIAVQWAKAADCHVIGTCSSEEKEKMLKELGCDRVINYKTENLGEILQKEYPKGIDVIWETIGGEVFETCLKNLAIKGRLIVIGSITTYKSDSEDAFKSKSDLSTLPTQLLMKSASIHGFIVSHYKECFASYTKYMTESLNKGQLKAITDDGTRTGKPFLGLEGIINAVKHLHSGKSIGKVIAQVY